MKTEDPGAHQKSPEKVWDGTKPHRKLGGMLQGVCRVWEHTERHTGVLGAHPNTKGLAAHQRGCNICREAQGSLRDVCR